MPYFPEGGFGFISSSRLQPPLPSSQHPKNTPRYLPGDSRRIMVSIPWSPATIPPHQSFSSLPLLSFGVPILFLLLCGHAFPIPVEHPLGSIQHPLYSTLRDGLDAKVLILGAGVAGITAAQKLESHGISDFLVIEAHHEVGGRLRSRPFGSPNHVYTSSSTGSDTLTSIEVGAQWIQGYHEQNPIWGLAKKHGVKTQLSDFFGNVSEFLPSLPVAG